MNTTTVDPAAPIQRGEVYQLAYGYALGAYEAALTLGSNIGIDTEDDVIVFAVTYADFHNGLRSGEQIPVNEAFAHWRYDGSILPTD